MRAGDEAFQELREAIEHLAAADAAELVAEARIEARAKVRSILVEAIAQGLLERSREELAAQEPRAARGGAGARAHATPGDPAAQPHAAPGDAAPQPHAEPRDPSPRLHAAPVEVAPQPTPDPPTTELAWYVYGVVGSERRLELAPELTGVDARSSPTVIVEGGLGAVASQVPLSEFGDETLRGNLNDTAWLEEKARSHENVLDHARRLTTVIPMRLCTIYTSESTVRELLAREKEWFTAALERLAGRAEWGVKVFAERSTLESVARERSPDLAGLDPETAKDEGEAYMRRKRFDRLLDEEVERLVDQCSGDIHERLTEIAAEGLVNPLQRPEVAGHGGEMVLNGVYLLDDGAEQAFHDAVAALRTQHEASGFDLVPTGPWPPYNFVKDSIEAAW